MRNESRESMVRAAAQLIGTHGVSATSFSDVIDASGAPRGSIYHHFPEGKRQLAEEAVRWACELVLTRQAAYDGPTAAGVISRFIEVWRTLVVRTNGAAGCAIAGVTLDSDASDALVSEVARASFRSWIALLTKQLKARGVPAKRAGSIAIATVAGMEGALILCRAEGGVEPLDAVAEELLRLLP